MLGLSMFRAHGSSVDSMDDDEFTAGEPMLWILGLPGREMQVS